MQVQKSLKMKIEAQGRFLDKIMEEYKNRAPGVKTMIKPYSPTLSLPSLSEESDQSNEKEFESDLEDASEISSKEDLRPPKRIKIQENALPQVHKIPSFNLDPQNLNLFSLDGISKNLYMDQEIGFPWGVDTFTSSPLLPGMYNHLNQ